MKNDWILDVLADLKSFAQANDLSALADQLDKTRHVAATEIVSASELAGVMAHGDDAPARDYSGGTRAGARAG